MKYYLNISVFIFFLLSIPHLSLWASDNSNDSILCNLKASQLINIADSLTYYDLSAADDIMRRVDTLYGSCLSPQLFIDYLQTKATIASIKSDFNQAIELADSALSLSISLGDSFHINYSKSLLGDFYSSLGQVERAVDYYLQTIPYDQKTKDTANLAFTYLYLASIYQINNEYPQVEIYLEKIEGLIDNNSEYLEFKKEISKLRAWIALENKSFAFADSLINSLDNLLLSNENNVFLSDYYSLKAEFYKQSGIHDTAWQYLTKAIQTVRELGDRYVLADYYLQGADLALKKHDLNAAERYLKLAEQLSDSIQSVVLYKELYKIKHDIALAKGDYKRAESSLRLYNKFSDSLRSEKMTLRLSKIEELRKEMERQQLLYNQQLLLDKNEKDQMLLRRRKIILTLAYIMLFGSLIALSIIYYFYRKAKKINRTKDRMISVISHDLRGPVYQIEQLLDLAIQSKGFEMIKKARLSTSNLRKTFDNLLYWAKSQIEGQHFKKSKIRLEDAVKESIAFHRPALEDKGIHIHTEGLEDKIVEFNPVHLEIILRNLLSNAVKFTPKGGEILVKANKNDRELILEVKDTGVGIPEELQKRMFDKRHMFTTRGTNNEPGAGLGLSLAYYFAQKNGANITVESTPGEGSTFQLHIPLST